VATAADAALVMELAGWTKDRLVEERLRRLPEAEWVYGRPNAGLVMAVFLHPAPSGSRLNGPDQGGWHAAAALSTAAFKVAHHLRREAAATGSAVLRRDHCAYTARLDGAFFDIRGQRAQRPAVYDPMSYAAGQAFGEAIRAVGGFGILYDSVRHTAGANAVAYRPPSVLDVTQADHWRITVEAGSSRIGMERLRGA
jgi:hypothetical protein